MPEAAYTTPDEEPHVPRGRPGMRSKAEMAARKGGAKPGNTIITVAPTIRRGSIGRRLGATDGPGRPSKFTPERAARIINLLSDGNFVSSICPSVNINETTYQNWIKRGEALDAQFIELEDEEAVALCGNEEDGRFLMFVRDVNRALYQAEAEALSCLRASFGADWRSADVYFKQSITLAA